MEAKKLLISLRRESMNLLTNLKQNCNEVRVRIGDVYFSGQPRSNGAYVQLHNMAENYKETFKQAFPFVLYSLSTLSLFGAIVAMKYEMEDDPEEVQARSQLILTGIKTVSVGMLAMTIFHAYHLKKELTILVNSPRDRVKSQYEEDFKQEFASVVREIERNLDYGKRTKNARFRGEEVINVTFGGEEDINLRFRGEGYINHRVTKNVDFGNEDGLDV